MKPGVVLPGGGEERLLEAHMDRQMGGCMAGFLQIFDRHQNLTGRRGIYAAKRLPSSAFSPVGFQRHFLAFRVSFVSPICFGLLIERI